MNATQNLSSQLLTAEQVSNMIKSGVIREEFMLLTPRFAGKYALQFPVTFIKPKSRPDVEIPLITLRRSDGKLIRIWGSTLFGAKVMPAMTPVKAATIREDMPLYFEDDAHADTAHLNSFMDEVMNPDGSALLPLEIEIVGATVKRSATHANRWPVSYRSYREGAKFLALHNSLMPSGSKASTWISEERLLELAALPKAGRTFKVDGVTVVVPATADLRIQNNADTDPRAASAQFIVRMVAEE